MENGANVDVSNNKGRTALMIASYKGLTDVVDLLLRYGAKVDKIDENQDTALTFAIKHHNPVNTKSTKYVRRASSEQLLSTVTTLFIQYS